MNQPLVQKISGSTRPGWRTTEFWLTVTALLLSAFFASGAVGDDSLTVKIAGVVGGILTTMGYQVSRGKVKQGDNPRPGYQSTEFWLTLLAHGTGLAFASGAVGDGSALAQVMGIVQMALNQCGYQTSRTLAKKTLPAPLLEDAAKT